jgi:hypothetical protein
MQHDSTEIALKFTSAARESFRVKDKLNSSPSNDSIFHPQFLVIVKRIIITALKFTHYNRKQAMSAA